MKMKSKRILRQIVRFIFAGFVSFLVDYGALVLLTEFLGVYYFLSASISFSVSLIINYILNMKYVFIGRKDISRRKEIVGFVSLSMVGLILNQIVLGVLVEIYNLYYMFAKIIATGIVMVWNYVSRKIFLEDKV